jgi:O-antigen ligase
MSGASVARPVSWTTPVREAVVQGWDTLWGITLFLISTVFRVLSTHSKSISRGVLFFLIAGTAAFTRDFSKLRIGPLYITEICMALLLVNVGTLLAHKKAALLPANRLARQTVYMVIAYIMYGALRFGIDLASSAFGDLLPSLRNFAIVYYASFSVLGWVVIQGPDSRAVIRNILTAIALVSTIASLWTVIKYMLGLPLWVDDTEFDVTKVIAGHAVVFAMLSLLVELNVLWLYKTASAGRRFISVIVLLLNILYIYLSGHRSALIACGIGIITMILSVKFQLRDHLHSKVRWRWVICALLIAVVGSYILSSHLQEFTLKYRTMLDPLAEINAAWRAAYWLNVFTLWRSAPITGVGFSHDFYDEEPFHVYPFEHYDPHNSYLALLARTGVCGLLLVLVTVFVFSRLMIQVLRHAGSYQIVFLASCLLSCFVTVGTFASFNVTLESPYHAIFFWLIVGMGIALAGSNAATNTAVPPEFTAQDKGSNAYPTG